MVARNSFEQFDRAKHLARLLSGCREQSITYIRKLSAGELTLPDVVLNIGNGFAIHLGDRIDDVLSDGGGKLVDFVKLFDQDQSYDVAAQARKVAIQLKKIASVIRNHFSSGLPKMHDFVDESSGRVAETTLDPALSSKLVVEFAALRDLIQEKPANLQRTEKLAEDRVNKPVGPTRP